ncbi:MAG: DNA-processing protein DprA [Propionibacteriales bacterium]|nr:DNA-processing protein DprA [Propionibacteriales bacterium]
MIPVDDPERRARLVLSSIGEPGDPRLLSLVAEIGPVAVLEALREQSAYGELRDSLAERLATCRPGDVLAGAARRGIRFVVPGDPEWPESLADLASVPLLHQRGGVPLGLWVRGPLRLDEVAGGVAVVGSRSATGYGGRVAGDLGAALADSGRAVISGAAFGIDQSAHRGALAVRGPTVAVLACGADRAYPLAHAQLLALIAEEGLVVSEAAPGCAPTRVRFLARNRLIAALARGTVVVEAAARSGALNTANWADSLGRSVMGVPGPVTSAASQGVHHLIRARNALLVTGPADVLEAVSSAGENTVDQFSGPTHPRDALSIEHRQVLDAVPVGRPATVQQVARAAGTSIRSATQALEVLRGAELVAEVGDRWRLTPARE